MSGSLGVAIPFWLDRADEEAVEIARAADRAGIETVWVGEMASFDAFALATAIGLQTERVRLTVGPLAVGVRSPVAIALGVSSVATLVGRAVDVALGASSPAIVSGWHDRRWSGLAGQMQEGVAALRALLDGKRVDFSGTHVRTRGFKLRRPQNEASLRAARAVYYQAIDHAWRAAQSPEPVSVELRTALRLAATHAVRTAADVVRAMYDLGGGSAIYDDAPLQRRFRDAHAATAHFQVNAATWELCGRLLLDQPTDTAML